MRFCLPVAALLALNLASPLPGAVVPKANNSDPLNQPSSWVGNVPPGLGDIAQWSSLLTNANTVTLGSDCSWLGIQIASPGGAVTLNPGHRLTLGIGGIDMEFATHDLSITCEIESASNQTWAVAANRTLTLGNTASGPATRLLPGPGTAILDGGASATYTFGTTTAGNNALALNGGTLEVRSGTLNLNSNNNNNDATHINGNSTFNLISGTVNSSFYTRLGSGASGTRSTLNVRGGLLINRGEILFGFGGSGSGTLTLTASGVVDSHFLRLGDTSTAGTHTVNLDGGLLRANRIFRNNGTAVFNFNGGTLQANSSPASPWFASSVSNVWVETGGAFIDSNGRHVTLEPGLRASVGSTGGVVKLGKGTLTLAGTNSYTGPTDVMAGSLVVNGRSTGLSDITVHSGATFGGTGILAAPVFVREGASLAPGAGELSVGSLTMHSNSMLILNLGTPGSVSNSRVQVNGELVLDGSVAVNDVGISTGAVYAAIVYTGSLVDNGLEIASNSAWDLNVDTSAPNLVRLTATRKFPFIEIVPGDLDVSSLYTNLTAVIHGFTTNAIWYEVRSNSASGCLTDFGAHVPSTIWPFTVRHLKAGTNRVTVFARDEAGAIHSNSIRLVLNLAADTPVRPRPVPAEIWWGGLSTNQHLLDPARPWEFVKRFQDGLFFHSAGYGGLTSSDKQELALMLRAYNTRYWVELGGGVSGVPGAEWVNFQANSGWGSHLALQQNLGLVMSQITHDYHMEDMELVCRVHPAWSAQDQVAWWTGDLSRASSSYPESSGLWRDIFSTYYSKNPHLKVGHTSSPVWWPWDGYPALAANSLLYNPLKDTNGTAIQVDGTNVSFSFNARDIVEGFINMAVAIDRPWFSFQSDCPWDYYGAWGNVAQRVSNRAKIRYYERALQSKGARHTLICNVSNSGSRPGGDDAQDLYYKQSSLNSMFLHQQEGGRADVYLFESWYFGIPHAAAPESKPGSYANLAMDAIKYLKGIKDTNGALQELKLTGLSSGKTNVVELRNLGDITCLPALVAFQAPGGTGSVVYFNAAGQDVTTEILSPGGYVHTNQLAPGQATQVRVVSSGSTLDRVVTIEAFWNPQDPTGIVRDRLLIGPPNQPPVLAPIAGFTLTAGQTLQVTNVATDPDLPSQSLAFSLLLGPTNASINSASGLLTWRPLIAQSPLVIQIRVRVADDGSPSLSDTQSFWVTVNQPVFPGLSSQVYSGGSFYFNVHGSPGPDYWILASTNLLHWHSILATNPSTLPFGFQDAAAGGYEQRFYRVEIGP